MRWQGSGLEAWGSGFGVGGLWSRVSGLDRNTGLELGQLFILGSSGWGFRGVGVVSTLRAKGNGQAWCLGFSAWEISLGLEQSGF